MTARRRAAPADGPPIGAHVSAAGGLPRAVERAVDLGCEATQVFVKSPNQWRAGPLSPAGAEAFRAARRASPLGPVVAHAAYLINLAATDRAVLRRSRRALADELDRVERLGLDALIVHPGAHLGAGEARGLERVADSLNRVLEKAGQGSARLLLENTAGQGTVLGRRLEDLAELLERLAAGRRIGVCLDTCHAFAAGYPLGGARGCAGFWEQVEATVGLDAVGCLHLNDSRFPQGSRRDRHANLGDGEIGPGLFRRLVKDSALSGIPMILETPLGDDGKGHARDLAKLRRWRG